MTTANLTRLGTTRSAIQQLLTLLHDSSLEDSPTIRVEVEPQAVESVDDWIVRHLLPDMHNNASSWDLDRAHIGPAVDPVDGGPCRACHARFVDREDGFRADLTILLLPIPHESH